MLETPPQIERFFEQFVWQPFHSHKKTLGWKEEVLSRPEDWRHRTVNILERGLADFDTPYKHLTPTEKVTIYCYQYMQKHTASTRYVLEKGVELGLGSPDNLILLDFGSGPATLAVAMAWQKAQDGNAIRAVIRPCLQYIGIERSKAMRDIAETIASESDLFHKASVFRFCKSGNNTDEVFTLVDSARKRIDAKPPSLVLNFSYFFSSRFLEVRDISEFVMNLLSRYSRLSIWLVYQNPADSRLRDPWQRFKRELRGFKSVESTSTKIFYMNSTHKRGGADSISLDFELMSHRPD